MSNRKGQVPLGSMILPDGSYLEPDSPDDARVLMVARGARFGGVCFGWEYEHNPCSCSCWGCKYHCGGCWRQWL